MRGLVGIIQALLIVFKLAGIGLIAEWSWFQVLAPIWITVLLIILLFILFPKQMTEIGKQ